MTLEEAIKHAEEKAKCGGRCGEEHAQLAMWLKELQKLRAVETEKRTEERTKTHACDCISRQAAIKAVMGLPTWWADEGGYYGGAQPPMEALLDPEDAVSAIENLPSAQPEIIYCKKCEHWTRTYGDEQWGLGDCDVFDKHLVRCNGYCAWAERRTDENNNE